MLELELLISGSYGIYIPQTFCAKFAQNISNIEDMREDANICLAGPDHEDYWEAWENLLDNVEINENGKKYTLHQDDDLWLVPEGYVFPDNL